MMNQRFKSIAAWSRRRIGYAVVGGILCYPLVLLLVQELAKSYFDTHPRVFLLFYPTGSRLHAPATGTHIVTSMLLGALIPTARLDRRFTTCVIGIMLGAYLGVLSRGIFESNAASSAVNRVAEIYASPSSKQFVRSPFDFHRGGEKLLPHHKDYPRLGDKDFVPALCGGAVCGALFAGGIVASGRRRRVLIGTAIAVAFVCEVNRCLRVNSAFRDWEQHCVDRMLQSDS